MLESIKVALCSQRHNACMPNVGWCEVTDMLFRNNARMAERTGFPTLGVLKPGAAADVIVMDYKPFTPLSLIHIYLARAGKLVSAQELLPVYLRPPQAQRLRQPPQIDVYKRQPWRWPGGRSCPCP